LHEADGNERARPHRVWSADREALIWRRARERTDSWSRDILIAHYLPYARVVAATYYSRRLHDEIEFAEYHQFAIVGMLEALDRYDPQGGAQFRTFAARRMHGAILDGLETLTEKQRQIAARKRIQREPPGSAVTAGDARGRIGGADADPLKRLSEVAFGLAIVYMLEGTGMIATDGSLGDASSPQQRWLERKQSAERLARVLERLPCAERTVLRSHYLQQQPFDEIGQTLGVTKGRVSQIHKQALLRMRVLLREPDRHTAASQQEGMERDIDR
jgi:RNA polymerase sigma factor for flagellar operon FliA